VGALGEGDLESRTVSGLRLDGRDIAAEYRRADEQKCDWRAHDD
jgi:hypothetical protein